MRHVNLNVMQIDGAKIVRHFVNVVLVNATLLMELAIAHQVRYVNIPVLHLYLRIFGSKLSKNMCDGFIWNELCIQM